MTELYTCIQPYTKVDFMLCEFYFNEKNLKRKARIIPLGGASPTGLFKSKFP